MFTANVGTPDRIARLVIGVVLFLLPFFTGAALAGAVGIVLQVIGVVLVVTAFLAFCPLYRIFGLSTARKG